jgi:hypothetical protein
VGVIEKANPEKFAECVGAFFNVLELDHVDFVVLLTLSSDDDEWR